jgi:DNA repair exonuclease SbcCD nuclease subunit
MIRFIHTADWQIGKPFANLPEVAQQLRAARLDAIDTIAARARDAGIGHVLVAGDVYDGENLSGALLRQPLERMRAAACLRWWLIGGNHDPDRAGGIWERVRRTIGLPANVHVPASGTPVEMAPGAWLLPAGLTARHSGQDTTIWMDSAATPEGALRIGLAHGSVRGFGQRRESPNVIDPARVRHAGLDWLGLGDWHGLKEIGPRVWYPGTPEPDAFREAETGTALAVSLQPGAAPQVEVLETGRHRWMERAITLSDTASLDDMVARLEQDADSRTMLWLKLGGQLPLAAMPGLDVALETVAARVGHLREDRSGLHPTADPAALAGLVRDGLLGQVAAGLLADAAADGPSARAATDALVALVRRCPAAGLEPVP